MTGDPMAARIAAIRVEIAEDGHHPGPYTLVNEDLLALCAEVDRLSAEADVMATLVRRLYTCDWADPISDEQEAMLTRIVEGDGRG